VLAAGGLATVALLFGPRLWGRGGGGGARARPAARAAVACGGGGGQVRASAPFVAGTVTAALSGGRILQGGDGEVYASIDLAVPPSSDRGERPPLDLALVIDRSGSMAGEKLAAAKRAADGLVARLADGDRVALVQYDDRADLLVPLAALDQAGRARLKAAIAEIHERGGTNLHGGMILGQAQLGAPRSGGRINRVVLLSDGMANQGVTDPAALGALAARAADRGVRLTTVGVGLDYNEDLMELLAENGRGRYHYVKDAASLEPVFAAELASMQATIATATELRLEPACGGVEILDVFGYTFRREGGAVVVPMADLFGGDSRRLVVRLRVPTGAAGRADVVEVALKATHARTRRSETTTLALGAEITPDAAAVESARDKTVLTHVVQMESAAAVREAAAAYARGDRSAAQALLKKKEAEMRGIASRYALPKEKVDRSLKEIPDFAGEIDAYAPQASGGKHALKLRKANAQAQMKSMW
jgi:Ca-activated chloride channel family protein